MAVEQGGPGGVGHKVELELLAAGQHHHVLSYARARLAADADQFEAVAMEMERMNVVAGIAKFQAVAATSVDGVGRFHGLHGKWLAVEQPLIEAVELAIVLEDLNFDGLIGLSGVRIDLAKQGVVPPVRLWRDLPRLAFFSCILDDNAHA